MKSTEPYVGPDSDYYLYSPSITAQETFLYPTHIGRFCYEPGYSISRLTYDSFLIMYILKGRLYLNLGEESLTALEGQFVLLDCFRAHAYHTDRSCCVLWLHYNGITARPYYELIHGRLGSVFALKDGTIAQERLLGLYRRFASGSPVQEALMSKYIVDILTEFALFSSGSSPTGAGLIDSAVSYIAQHAAEPLTVEQLASHCSLSVYHFIRVFHKETGFTPHEYIINVRMNTARYMLANTDLPVKEICYISGFSSESVFSTAFRKKTGMTPLKYRAMTMDRSCQGTKPAYDKGVLDSTISNIQTDHCRTLQK